MEDLYSACLFGDYLAVQKALDLKENPNLLNDKTTYPLSVASLFGYESIAELLLRSGASVTVKDSDWLTPLHWACFGGYEHIVSLLLDNRAEINSRDKFWLTPVHCAAINGSIKSMEVISVKNSNLKMTDRCGRQPIHLAALFANTEVLCYLLNKGIPVDVVDKHSKTPLHYASFRGHLHVAKLLISQSCDIHLKDRKGYSALHYAAISGNSYIVNYLLQQGLSPNVQSLNGATPFHLASMYLNVSVCEVLKSFGCDVHSLNFHQQNAFHYFALSSTSLSCPSSMKQFVQSNVKKLTSLIKYNPSSKWLTNDSVFFNDDWEVRVEATYNFLAECSIDSNLNDINGMVPLHLSTLVTEQSVCQFLLNDHSKHKLCKNGQSIIHLATSLASKSLCSLYISSGLPIDQKDDLGRLPLHMAALSGDINCLKIFLTHNSMEKFDKNNRNVIFYAIMSDQLDIVEYLLKNGYNLSLYDCNGASPLHYVAKYSKNPELMAYLIKVNQKLLLNKDNFDYSPLVVSIFNENVEVFKTVIPVYKV